MAFLSQLPFSTSLLLLLYINYCVAPVSAVPDSLFKYSPRIPDIFLHLRPSQSSWTFWEMVEVATICGALPGLWFLRKHTRRSESSSTSWASTAGLNDEKASSIRAVRELTISTDAASTDPGLLKKHSEFKTYSTNRYTYPSLRIFFQRHPQANKLPTTPAPLPLLVFIHGLGGSVAQFHPLLTSLVNLANCLSIDLPGCGLSSLNPTSWDAYTTEAMAELVATIIDDYREKETGQGVVLIGHSMGCSIATLIASQTSTLSTPVAEHIVGLVAICPRAEPPSEKQTNVFKKLLWVPNPIFDLWRRWDRRGGPESASVKRFVGADSDSTTKELQYRFNEQSKTEVWRRMAAGSLPKYRNGVANGGLPGKKVWAGLDVPVFLVAGESDNVSKPVEIEKIAGFLGKSHPTQVEPIVDSAAPMNAGLTSPSEERRIVPIGTSATALEMDSELHHEDPSTPTEELSNIPPQPRKPRKVLKTTILPAPASHALLYMPSTVRTLAGLISDFLCTQVSPRLSLGWQLQFLSTAGKWDVKNLAKWQAVAPVSEPIAGVFRAMKTLREVDESHSPEVFVKNWGAEIKDVVDISHESPVYDPRGLERGGIHYHKFPTVSKIPPTGDEVKGFINLVDRLRDEQGSRSNTEGWTGKYYVGVHCHYGFNRTGYFIVCYLVERCDFSVQGAIDEFARRRPKGIKHAHFMDQLFVRYCVGLKRAPTL